MWMPSESTAIVNGTPALGGKKRSGSSEDAAVAPQDAQQMVHVSVPPQQPE
jgi:hypothetical protein